MKPLGFIPNIVPKWVSAKGHTTRVRSVDGPGEYVRETERGCAMSMVVNAEAYRKLIREDIAWLDKMPRTLERDHILQVLECQIRNAETITASDRLLFQSQKKACRNQVHK